MRAVRPMESLQRLTGSLADVLREGRRYEDDRVRKLLKVLAVDL